MTNRYKGYIKVDGSWLEVSSSESIVECKNQAAIYYNFNGCMGAVRVESNGTPVSIQYPHLGTGWVTVN